MATEASIRAELAEFERRFGMDSETYFRLRCEDAEPKDIEPFDRLVWSSTCQRLQRTITGDWPQAPGSSH